VKRFLVPLLPLPFVLAVAAWTSARVADRAGEAAAVALVAVAPWFAQPPAAEPEAALDGLVPTSVSLVDLAPTEPFVPSSLSAPTKKGTKHAAKPVSSTPVVYVSQKQVVAVATTGARPRGVAVPAAGGRPPGLKLSGVAALGIGMQDGDVLTRAVGQPALSSGAVIQAVLAARARRAPLLEGEFWRGSQRWLLRVEQPYLDSR
jgi:hypothetical protein